MLTEVTSLNEKVELLKKECEDLEEQSDCTSLNSLLEHLTKKLLAKEKELQVLKQEKNAPVNQSHNISHYGLTDESKYGLQPMDISAMSQNKDMEKIFKELESVKMVLEHDVDDEEREEPIETYKKGNINQNRSFSHYVPPGKKEFLEKKMTPREVPNIEKQIRDEVHELIASRTKIQNDIAQFNKEFSQADLNSEM